MCQRASQARWQSHRVLSEDERAELVRLRKEARKHSDCNMRSPIDDENALRDKAKPSMAGARRDP